MQKWTKPSWKIKCATSYVVDPSLRPSALAHPFPLLTQGGDAEHSVLVKGLDMALLERMKYQQASVSDKTLEEVEDELDLALLEKASGKAAKGKGKRTRDEMIAEMKAGRGGAAAGEEEGKGEGKGKEGKFKPVKRDGWKAVGAAPPPPAEGEKKLRKKKKKVKQDDSTAAPPPPPPAAEVKPQPLPLLQPTVDLEDDEFDIFGGAGDYKGLDTDSDSDNEGKIKEEAPPPPAAAAGAAKRSYFDDEEEDESITTGPSAVTNLASTAAAIDGSAASGDKRRREVGSDGEEEDDGPTMKLQPLSGSRLSARELLELDDAAAKEEKRKEVSSPISMLTSRRVADPSLCSIVNRRRHIS